MDIQSRPILVSKIISDHSNLFQWVNNPHETLSIHSIVPPEKSTQGAGSFLSSAKQFQELLDNQKNNSTTLAAVYFIPENLKASIPMEWKTPLIFYKSLNISLAHILKYFDHKNEFQPHASGISPHAYVHPTAIIGSAVTIAPFSIIGPDVQIGDGVNIGPHCTIEGQSKIGAYSKLQSHVFIGSQTSIGSHCIIQPFASIGSDGYGYASTPTGILKIPQVGKVIIEDQVEIGSNTCIDRATLAETKIGFGSKLDNLVHIAHNCTIGKYCFITAGFATAGSTTIDDFFVCGGTVAIADHVHITKNVTLAGASVVTNDITEPGQYGGAPLQPMMDYLKTKSTFSHLPTMRKQLNRIMKHLNLE